MSHVTYPCFMTCRFHSFITSFSPSLTSVNSSSCCKHKNINYEIQWQFITLGKIPQRCNSKGTSPCMSNSIQWWWSLKGSMEQCDFWLNLFKASSVGLDSEINDKDYSFRKSRLRWHCSIKRQPSQRGGSVDNSSCSEHLSKIYKLNRSDPYTLTLGCHNQ